MFLIYLMTIEDEEERKTIEELYEKYKYQCLHMAMIRVNNQQIAEDIVQEVFIKIIKHRKKYLKLSCSDFEKLLFVMVRSTVIDYYRVKKNTEISVEDFSDEPDNRAALMDEKIILDNDLERVFEKINEFDEITKSIIYYRCMDISVKVIADMLEIPKKNVEMKLYRARKKLRKMLGEEGFFD